MKKIIGAVLAGVMVLGLVGCSSNGGSTAKSVPTSELATKVKENIEMRKTAAIDDELAKSQYHLNLDDVEEYTIENGMMNSGLETIAIVKAKEGKTDAVKASLEQVVQDKKASAFYPGEPEAVEAAKIEVIGDYVVLFIIPDYDETGEDFSGKAVTIVQEALK